MTVTVIVGPPCAGKSSYAWGRQYPGEPVVDFDRLAGALGSDDPYDAPSLIQRASYAARAGAIALLLETDSSIDSQIIHTAPNSDQIARYENAGCEFVVVDPGEDECLDRARDQGRTAAVRAAIRAWYADPPALPEGTSVVSDVAENRADRKATNMGRKVTASRYWGEAPLPRTKAEFFNAVTTPAPVEDGGSVATIRMYGPIDSWGGFWGISAKDMGNVLDALPESVDRIILRINSPGGEVFEGAAILNMLRAHKATVTAVVDGLAASAASVIAAGADDTVMSPGTSMMIHKASTIEWGNADDMRKTASTLDKIDATITEIYVGKAGADKDWATLLSEETWLTAAEAKSLGLADRVSVIPDAGEAVTAGEEEPDETLVVPDAEVEDSAAATLIRIVNRHLPQRPPAPVGSAPKTARASAPGSERPAEPGTPNTNTEGADMALKDTIAARLGISAENVTDDMVVAALDEALAEQPNATAATPPAGTQIIDEATLAQMRADAAAGRQARDQQIAASREAVVDTAIDDGKIPPARRDHYLGLMKADEEGTTALLAALSTGVIPVEEKGVSGGVAGASDDADAVYAQAAPAFGFAPSAANEKE